MMSNNSSNIQDKLALLKQAYRDQLPVKIEEINKNSVLVDGMGEAEVRRYLETLEGLAHKLAGSGATFGFPDISISARSLEQVCVVSLDEGGFRASAVREAVTPYISSLRLVVDDVMSGQEQDKATQETFASKGVPHKLLLIISNDEDEAARLERDIESSGFAVEHVHDDVDLEAVITSWPRKRLLLTLQQV